MLFGVSSHRVAKCLLWKGVMTPLEMEKVPQEEVLGPGLCPFLYLLVGNNPEGTMTRR